MEAFILTFETIYSGLYHSEYIFSDQSEAFQLVRGRLACLPPQTRQDKQREARRGGFACHVSSFTSRAN